MNKLITITKKNQGERLDKFLNGTLTAKTRSQIKKMIESNLVLINNKPAKVHHFLKKNDIISIASDEKSATAKKTKNHTAHSTQHTAPKIIFENDNFLILEKPAGLLIHPTDRREMDTLADWLKEKYPGIEKVGEEKYRGGIIHRMDKDVSGIMVATKNNPAYNHLKEQFKARKVKKNYLALVYGRVSQEQGEIDLPIGRSKDGQFVAHPRSGKIKFQEKDKIAKTEYNVLEYIKDYTLLDVRILTGRTHQIRAHLTAIGHPILGDRIYKPRKKFFRFLRQKIKVVDPGRIFLHSHKIGFYDLNNQWAEFSSPLPKKLTEFLNEAKTK